MEHFEEGSYVWPKDGKVDIKNLAEISESFCTYYLYSLHCDLNPVPIYLPSVELEKELVMISM